MRQATVLNVKIAEIDSKIKPLKNKSHLLSLVHNVCCSVHCREICLALKKRDKERLELIQAKHESLEGHATKKHIFYNQFKHARILDEA